MLRLGFAQERLNYYLRKSLITILVQLLEPYPVWL